jgi:hypothetical protein
VDPEKVAAAKVEFDQLEQKGIIWQPESPWASPLHMVRKQDGSWQTFGNYCQLNLVTIPDADPLPNMMDFAARMSSCTIFSKVDLRKGYRQIPKQNYMCKLSHLLAFKHSRVWNLVFPMLETLFKA